MQLFHVSEFPEMFCMLRGLFVVIEPTPIEVCRTKEEKQDKYDSAHNHEHQDGRGVGGTREPVGMAVCRIGNPSPGPHLSCSSVARSRPTVVAPSAPRKTMRPRRQPLPATVIGMTKIPLSHSVVRHWCKELGALLICLYHSRFSSPVVPLACQARVFANSWWPSPSE